MPARITLRDIAANCDCVIATVSWALRNRTEIPVATRLRIQSTAKKMGYVPDPAMAALVEHRRGLRPARYLETLALVSPGLTLADTQKLPRRLVLIEAVRERAKKLGYQVDFFHLPWEVARQAELVRVWQRRRIRGLIFLPSDPPAETATIPWEDFASVRLYRPPMSARLLSVDTDVYQGIHLILEQLVAANYRRPGLLLPKLVAHNTAGIWPRYLAMIAAEQTEISPTSTFEFDGELSAPTARRAFLAWVCQARPDVIIGFYASVAAAVLRNAGYTIPGKIGLIDLDIPAHLTVSPLAGLLQSRTAIGWSAVDLLHGLLITHSMGPPTFPSTVKMAFRWIEGPSIRDSKG